MKLQNYYKIALLLPLAVPLLCYGLNGFFRSVLGLGNDSAIISINAILALSGILGGVPYALFAIACYFWGRHKPPSTLRKFSYVMPLLFAPFLIVCLVLFDASMYQSNDQFRLEGLKDAAILYGSFALAIGYFYVVLAHLVAKVLIYFKIIKT